LPLRYSSSAAPGAYAFGTLNLVACGIGRSIEGAMFGRVVGIELYKVVVARFAAPLAIGVSVGRIGCYCSGLDDFTYRTPPTGPGAMISATASCGISRS
jgi:phosphatidylglycerol:prolipoprotein diacylglycerol transferase